MELWYGTYILEQMWYCLTLLNSININLEEPTEELERLKRYSLRASTQKQSEFISICIVSLIIRTE